jgi:hypothetical protein
MSVPMKGFVMSLRYVLLCFFILIAPVAADEWTQREFDQNFKDGGTFKPEYIYLLLPIQDI